MTTGTKFNRRELLGMVALVAVAWVVILFGISKWQRSRLAGGRGEPQLIHYPGTESMQEQTAANLGLHKYWFRLNEEYPSKSVYYFYQNQLEATGWKRPGPGEPRWGRSVEKGETRDLFEALWVSRDNLWTIDLQMMSVVKPLKSDDPLAGEQREPGIQVFVTLRRAMHPGILMQEPPEPSPGKGMTGVE